MRHIFKAEAKRPTLEPMPEWRMRALYPQSRGVSARFANAGAVDFTYALAKGGRS